MKKIFTVLLVGGIAFASCKKSKNPIDCTAAANNMSKAAQAYATSQTKENCQAYKNALRDLVNNSSCTGLTESQKQEYNSTIDGLNCDAQ